VSQQRQNCALILIDVQRGFLDSSYWGKCSHPNIERNIESLLTICRELKYPIVHVQHLSTEEFSPLRPGQHGSEFIESCAPRLGERVFQKSVNSAFIGTNLEAYLRSQKIESIVLVGFTSDHCVSTTARMASNLGFRTFVVADCTATFDRRGLDSTISASLVHDVSMASLNSEFATIVKTASEFKAMCL